MARGARETAARLRRGRLDGVLPPLLWLNALLAYAFLYLPIVILTNYAETKNLPTGNGEGLIMTGPGFVTQKDAADVIALAAKGLR